VRFSAEKQPKRIKLNPIDKQHNKQTLDLGEQIRQNRDHQLNKPEIYTGYEKEQLRIKVNGDKSFVEYFKELADKRKASNHDNWISAYHYFERFTGGKLMFSDLNEKFCNDFRDYISNVPSKHSSTATLAQNSALAYFNKFKAALKQAYKDGYLQYDLNVRIDRIKEADSQRNFLTSEELNSLANTASHSRGAMRPSFAIKNPALSFRRRRECRAPDAPDSRVCRDSGRTHTR